MRKWELIEFGSGTRRRPIGRDYAGAKDAECGLRPVGAIGAYAPEGMMAPLRSVGLYD
jgi:hypothetical protein